MARCQIVVFTFLLGLLALPVQAEEISTAYGYTLGMPMSEVQVLSTSPGEYGATLHVVRPAADSGVAEVLLGTGKDGQHVARIIGHSQPMPASDCFAQLAKTVERLRQRYPGSGYYAMDDTDMIYQQDRNILLSCEEQGDQSRLVVEYRDERL